MPFKRYVEIGRVAQINYGKEYGRLVVIVDVIDQNRALVDAPDMVRSQVNFKRLSLTDIKIDIKRVPKKKDLVKAMEDVVSLLFYRLLLLLILSLGYS
ncbi:Putative 60S ribosomal protein L14 [Glycine soja]|nr:Putative 60S ribosomal protein L14 [Glycine soja]